MRPARGDTLAKGLGRLDTESGDPGEVLSAPPGAADGCTFSLARPLGTPAAAACSEADNRAGEALSGEAVVRVTLQQGKGECRQWLAAAGCQQPDCAWGTHFHGSRKLGSGRVSACRETHKTVRSSQPLTQQQGTDMKMRQDGC